MGAHKKFPDIKQSLAALVGAASIPISIALSHLLPGHHGGLHEGMLLASGCLSACLGVGYAVAAGTDSDPKHEPPNGSPEWHTRKIQRAIGLNQKLIEAKIILEDHGKKADAFIAMAHDMQLLQPEEAPYWDERIANSKRMLSIHRFALAGAESALRCLHVEIERFKVGAINPSTPLEAMRDRTALDMASALADDGFLSLEVIARQAHTQEFPKPVPPMTDIGDTNRRLGNASPHGKQTILMPE
jgi:hypothetical protein